MSKDVSTQDIVKHLKEKAEEAKQRLASKAIEKLSESLLGDQHFAHGREAQLLAAVDVDAFALFAEGVLAIRKEHDAKFNAVTARLGDDNENN